ncbi:MAG: hypothetical protein QGI18_06130, partial [Candidatus Marinimicrobia bacterium]|nr:hypothetical protein [Candidatus Neomarinimicrobiota bacterium]
CYISPIRNVLNYSVLQYNRATNEVTEAPGIDISSIITQDLSVNNNVVIENSLIVKGDASLNTFSGKYIKLSSTKIGIGEEAGSTSQNVYSVAIGNGSGRTSQGNNSVAIGNGSGRTSQGTYSVAIGNFAGTSNQGNANVAIGNSAGYSNQGTQSVAIGYKAGETNQHANTIVLNAKGASLNTTDTSGLYIAPIREVNNTKALYYNVSTGEVTYNDVSSGGSGGGGGITSGSDVSLSSVDISGILKGKTSNNQIALGSHIIPTANAQFDLGSAEYKIRHLFLSDNSLYVGPSNENTAKNVISRNSRNEIQFNGDISSNFIHTDDLSVNNNVDIENRLIVKQDISAHNFKSTRIFVGDDTENDIIKIGRQAGQYNPGNYSIAIGYDSGCSFTSGNSSGLYAIALGALAGRGGQGGNSIAIGYHSGGGNAEQGSNSICIGSYSKTTSTGGIVIATNGECRIGGRSIVLNTSNANFNSMSNLTNTIVLNAKTMSIKPSENDACYISPIRNVLNYSVLQYNRATNE